MNLILRYHPDQILCRVTFPCEIFQLLIKIIVIFRGGRGGGRGGRGGQHGGPGGMGPGPQGPGAPGGMQRGGHQGGNYRGNIQHCCYN